MVTEPAMADVIPAAVAVGTFGLLVAARFLGWGLALVVALAKVALPAVYFGTYFDGTWVHVDDRNYNRFGALLSERYNPLTMITDETARKRLAISANRGIHVLYTYYDAVTKWVFGRHYFAPVFGNVALTFVAAWLLASTAGGLGFGSGYVRGLFLVALFEPQMLAWSSLVNVKDVLISVLTLALLLALWRCARRRSLAAAAAAAGCCAALAGLRFYVPVIALSALAAWLLLQRRGAAGRALLVTLGALVAFIAVFPLLGRGVFGDAAANLEFDNMVLGGLRVLISPRPWGVEAGYSFLEFPALVHWLLFVPVLAGVVLLWRRSADARLWIFYVALLVFVYAAAGEGYQGPRQRLQFGLLWIWFGWHALVELGGHRWPVALPGPGWRGGLAGRQ